YLLQAVRQLATDLQEIPETDSARPAAHRFHVQLGDGRLAALVGRLIVKAVRLHVLKACLGDGNVASHRRPEERLLGLGDKVEEGGGGLVLLRRRSPESPDRAAAERS